MSEKWMPRVELPISIEVFRQLPRHPAYKFEYYDHKAHLSARPRFGRAALDLASFLPSQADSNSRLLQPNDWSDLLLPFAAAFSSQQPFSGLTPELRLQAARESLHDTQSGEFGPLLEFASFVYPSDQGLVGAALVTLVPLEQAWDSFQWRGSPPCDAVERKLGRPHLTWIFVEPYSAQRGIGSALLSAVVSALLQAGFSELVSTFMIGNHSSMLWHWQAGFRLLPSLSSQRHVSPRIRSLLAENSIREQPAPD
jgi:hypothetical protein